MTILQGQRPIGLLLTIGLGKSHLVSGANCAVASTSAGTYLTLCSNRWNLKEERCLAMATTRQRSRRVTGKSRRDRQSEYVTGPKDRVSRSV